MKKSNLLYRKLLIFQIVIIMACVIVINLLSQNIDSFLWRIFIMIGLMIPIGVILGFLGRWYLLRKNKNSEKE